jgi:ABC-type antimicrobial peptide transport system permease subunit
MSYMVARRTRELGVRVALGATRVQITRLVVGSGAGLAAAGVAIGLVLSLVGGRLLEPHLFETAAFDPLVATGVAVLLMAVALLAGWIPARRAMRVSPTEALRSE